MTAWRPADPGPIVLRPKKGRAELAVGPAQVRLRDERGERVYPRGPGPAGPPAAPAGSPGAAVAGLCGRYESKPSSEGVARIEAVELVDDRANPVDGAPWAGRDAAALERAAAATGLPLEWAPTGEMAPAQPVPPRAEVLLRRLVRRGGTVTGEYDPSLSVTLGRQQVVVDAPGRRLSWPRIGYAPPDVPTVARLRIYQYFVESWKSSIYLAAPTLDVRHVGLLGLDGSVLCLLPWAGDQRDVLWQAAFAVGLLVEHQSQDAREAQLAKEGVPVV